MKLRDEDWFDVFQPAKADPDERLAHCPQCEVVRCVDDAGQCFECGEQTTEVQRR